MCAFISSVKLFMSLLLNGTHCPRFRAHERNGALVLEDVLEKKSGERIKLWILIKSAEAYAGRHAVTLYFAFR